MFGRRKKSEPPAPETNRINDLIDRLAKAGRLGDLESELARFDPAKLTGEERETWYRFRGIAPFQRGDRALAFERFQEAVQACPDSAMIRFSLGQEHEFRGEIDEMLGCFDGATFPGVSPRYALAEARYAYLWNRTDKARAYIAPLFPVYLHLKILDDMFLYMRELPFFYEPWAYLAAFSQLDGDFNELERLTQTAAAECTEFDFDYLRAELEAFRSGDFTRLKDWLRHSIEDTPAGHPKDYPMMRLGVLLAQETDDSKAADDLLDDVELTEDDFPWLDDMRVLAQCERARAGGNDAREADLRREFLRRQPMLFEPDHAVNFNLLGYQETLKPEYQARRGT